MKQCTTASKSLRPPIPAFNYFAFSSNKMNLNHHVELLYINFKLPFKHILYIYLKNIFYIIYKIINKNNLKMLYDLICPKEHLSQKNKKSIYKVVQRGELYI